MTVINRLLLTIILILFSFSIVNASPIILEEDDAELITAEDTEATGIILIKVTSEQTPDDLSLHIALHRIRTNHTQSVTPGEYKIGIGEYIIRLFYTLPDKDTPNENYEIIEERFVIREGEKITKKYRHPKRRLPITGHGSMGNAEKTGTILIKIESERIPNDLPLRIKLFSIRKNRTINVNPGEYKLAVGKYTLRLFRSLPGIDKPYEKYQTIEDSFLMEKGKRLSLLYPQPKRRLEITGYGAWGIMAGFVSMPGSYKVPNPLKAYVKKYNTDPNGTVEDTVSYSDSGYAASLHYGGSIYTRYLLAGKPMMVEGQMGYQSGKSLYRAGGSIGFGYYKQSTKWAGWFSVGGGSEIVGWSGLKAKGPKGSVDVGSGMTNTLFYIQGGVSPSKGGLTMLLRYDITTQTPSLHVGWSWGWERRAYTIPESVSVD